MRSSHTVQYALIVAVGFRFFNKQRTFARFFLWLNRQSATDSVKLPKFAPVSVDRLHLERFTAGFFGGINGIARGVLLDWRCWFDAAGSQSAAKPP